MANPISFSNIFHFCWTDSFNSPSPPSLESSVWLLCRPSSNTAEWWMFMSLIFTHRYDASVQFDSVKTNEANESESRFTRSSLRLTAQRRRFGLDHLHVRRDGARRDTTFFQLVCVPHFQPFCPGRHDLAAGGLPVSWYTHAHTHTRSAPWPQTLHCITVTSQTPQNKISFFFREERRAAPKKSCHQKRVLWWKCRKTGWSPSAFSIFPRVLSNTRVFHLPAKNGKTYGWVWHAAVFAALQVHTSPVIKILNDF